MAKNKPLKSVPNTPTFKDITRLYQIMDNIGLARQLANPILETFTEDLNQVYEISLNDSKELGIMVMGKGLPFFQRAAKFMEQAGIAEEEIQYLMNCGEAFEYRSIFFKIDLSDQGVEEISYYHRKKLTLEEIHIWLASSRINEEEQEKVAAIMRFLDKDYAQVGVTIKPGVAGFEKIYFNLMGHISSWYKMAAAVKAVLKISDKAILELVTKYFMTHKRSLYFAVAFKDQQMMPVAQVVVYGIDDQVSRKLYDQQNFSQQTIETIDYALQTSGKTHIDYISFKIPGEEIQSIKTYFYKEYVKDY